MKKRKQYNYLTGMMGELYLKTRLNEILNKMKELNDSHKYCEFLYYKNEVLDLYRNNELSQKTESVEGIYEYEKKVEKIMNSVTHISKGKVHILMLNINLNRIDNEIIRYLNKNDVLVIGYNKEENDYENLNFEYCIIEALGYFLKEKLFNKYKLGIMEIVDKNLSDVNLYCTSEKDEETIAIKLIMYAITYNTDLEEYLNETHYTKNKLKKIRRDFMSMLTPGDKNDLLLSIQ